MSRHADLIRAEWEARDEAERRGDWDHLDDGRDEPPPEPSPDVPEEFHAHCEAVRAAQRRMDEAWRADKRAAAQALRERAARWQP